VTVWVVTHSLQSFAWKQLSCGRRERTIELKHSRVATKKVPWEACTDIKCSALPERRAKVCPITAACNAAIVCLSRGLSGEKATNMAFWTPSNNLPA
jgi:hypothetical protein